MSARILVVEDEYPIREMIKISLTRFGFEIGEAESAQQAEKILPEFKPDLILLDWMLPDINGVDLARRWKRQASTRDISIIMVTAKDEEENKVKGLDSGADDYVTKPFSPRELMARIRAVLRRSSPLNDDNVITADELVLDPVSHRVTIDTEVVDMGPTEYRLLHFFMTHQERVFSRTQLLDNAWGNNVFVEERTVDVHIRRLRKAIGHLNCDRFIQTVRGAGYRFSTKA